MPDREKVINSFNDSIKNLQCGFVDGVGDVYAVSGETIMGALALLKEQEAIKIKVKKINESGRCGRCPSCNNELNETDYPNYCGFCGQAVTWY